MRLFEREVEGYPKAIVILVAVMLVSAGLCGLQLVFYRVFQMSYGPFVVTGVLELIAFVVSTVGFVIVSILWAVQAIRNKLSQAENAPSQSLFPSEGQIESTKGTEPDKLN